MRKYQLQRYDSTSNTPRAWYMYRVNYLLFLDHGGLAEKGAAHRVSVERRIVGAVASRLRRVAHGGLGAQQSRGRRGAPRVPRARRGRSC